jgi:uncharacterized protein DUF4388
VIESVVNGMDTVVSCDTDAVRGDRSRTSYMNGLVMSTLDPRAAGSSNEKPYWGDARAWELLAQVVDGKLSVQAACERHRMRNEDVQEWLRGFHRSALIAFDDQLRRALIRQGATPEALGGPELSVSLADISIVDWIQAIQLFAKHAVITVMHEASESRLWCSKGALIDAESGQLRGEAAVYRIVGLERGQVVTELRAVRRERTIRTSTQALLLEAARRKDEAALLRRRLGDLNRFFQSVETSAINRSLNTVEAAVLCLFGMPRRLSDVLDESDLGDVETLAALESLMRSGHIVQARTPEPAPEPAQAAVADDSAGNRVLPVSFAWPQERAIGQRNFRWLGSTLLMALIVSLAAWLGAKSSVSTQTLALAPLPPTAPTATVASGAAATAGAGAAAPDTYAVAVRAYPLDATLEVDGRDIGSGFYHTRLPRDGTLHELRISAAGFVPARILFVDAPPPLDVRLEPLPVPQLAEPAEGDATLTDEGSAHTEPSTWSERRASAARRKNAARGELSAARRVTEVPASATKKKPFVQIIEPPTPASLSSRAE